MLSPTWRNGRRDRLRIYYLIRCGGSSPLVGTLRGPVGARGLAGRRLLCKEKIVGSNPTGSTPTNAAVVSMFCSVCGRIAV